MRHIFWALGSTLWLAGCQHMPIMKYMEGQDEQPANPESALAATINNNKVRYANSEHFRFTRAESKKPTAPDVLQLSPSMNINFYVQGLVQDLLTNLQYVNEATPILVASFVDLDSDLKQGDLFSKQLSEALLHEIHQAGLPVIDHKVTEQMSVTEQGDFMLTRDYKKLSAGHPARYIVLGTFAHHQSGILVNARVVGAKSKAVVGSAQSFIPATVVNSLHEHPPVIEEYRVPLLKNSLHP